MALERLLRIALSGMAVVATSALGAATTSAADSCPSNAFCVAGQPCESSTAVSGGREVHFGGASALATYDWSTGTCRAFTQLPCDCPPSMEGRVEANQDFVVTGLSPGTPLSIQARIRVVASISSGGGPSASSHASGWLEHAEAGRAEATAGLEGAGLETLDQVLSLDVPNLAGETFRLTMGARSDALAGLSNVGVTLSFVNLPPGASVVSCPQGLPVPTRPTSWGRLKSGYR